MLRAINFGGFTQDGGAAVGHQQIHRSAQRRVGADARVAVRAAALQAHRDVLCTARLARIGVGFRQHFLHKCNAFFDGLARAPTVLDVEHFEVFASAQTAVL